MGGRKRKTSSRVSLVARSEKVVDPHSVRIRRMAVGRTRGNDRQLPLVGLVPGPMLARIGVVVLAQTRIRRSWAARTGRSRSSTEPACAAPEARAERLHG
ncbi:hypothetical protein GCM10023199_32750 [Actinomycetospora chibensis]